MAVHILPAKRLLHSAWLTGLVLLLALGHVGLRAQTAFTPHPYFQHGVASGDPLQDRVILWARATPPPGAYGQSILVRWQISRQPDFADVANQGASYARPEHDYTLHIDAKGLEPDTWYYYRFFTAGDTSRVGRTRTTPDSLVVQLRFGVLTCANNRENLKGYQYVAQRQDLDAVIHLGDYIYEYGDQDKPRPKYPPKTLETLQDYRQRYAQYRMDPHLQQAHQQYPWLCVWDDHETTNDCYQHGKHGMDSLAYSRLKRVARQAWYEWLPVRRPDSNDPERIWRRSDWGPLLKVLLLDTRRYGRDPQVPRDDPRLHQPDRSLLGETQRQWLFQQLDTSTTQWNLLAQQVLMAPLSYPTRRYHADKWEGYPAARDSLLLFLRENDITNVGVVTGDYHALWATELRARPRPQWGRKPRRRHTLAAEWVTPSIASGLRSFPPGVLRTWLRLSCQNHIRWAEPNHDGFLVLSVSPHRMQGDYYLLEQEDPHWVYGSHFAKGLYRTLNDARLRKTNDPQPALRHYPTAPLGPSWTESPSSLLAVAENAPRHLRKFAYRGAFPPLLQDEFQLRVRYARRREITLQLQETGSGRARVTQGFTLLKRNRTLKLNTRHLSPGFYTLQFELNGKVLEQKLQLLKPATPYQLTRP